MSLEVASLPLCPSVRSKLNAAGYASAAAVANADPAHLTTRALLTPEEAQHAQRAAAARSAPGLAGAHSAKSLYDRERRDRRIITFSAGLDGILGGGIALRQMTELCGGPGLGKTQLCMQLALDAQIPRAFGGLGAQALFIDSEGGLTPGRLGQMADALVAHLRRLAEAKADPARRAGAAALTRDALLDGIHYYRVHGAVEQLAVIDALDATLATHGDIRLVVLDSIAFHFRQDQSDLAARTRQLARAGQILMELAGRHNVAVVMTNHVTTRPGSDGAPARLIPALGDTWAHAATSRLMLYWEGGVRRAFLYKSPSLPAASAEYLVTADGIRSRRPAAAAAAAAAGGGKRPRSVEHMPGAGT